MNTFWAKFSVAEKTLSNFKLIEVYANFRYFPLTPSSINKSSCYRIFKCKYSKAQRVTRHCRDKWGSFSFLSVSGWFLRMECRVERWKETSGSPKNLQRHHQLTWSWRQAQGAVIGTGRLLGAVVLFCWAGVSEFRRNIPIVSELSPHFHFQVHSLLLIEKEGFAPTSENVLHDLSSGVLVIFFAPTPRASLQLMLNFFQSPLSWLLLRASSILGEEDDGGSV